MKMFVITIAAVVLYTVAVTTDAQRITASNRSQELGVQFNQTSFFLLEPMHVRFTFPMPDDGVTLPRISQDMVVQVTFEGKTTKFQGLTSALTIGGTIRLPYQQKQLQSEQIEKYQLIDRTLEFFPKPGEYQIKFILNDLSSKSFSINILPPSGLDKQAFDFLVSRKGSGSFGWIWNEPDGVGLLEQFVREYGDTVYGDFAIQKLANIYLAQSDVRNAELQLKRLALSNRPNVAAEANKQLSEITSSRTRH